MVDAFVAISSGDGDVRLMVSRMSLDLMAGMLDVSGIVVVKLVRMSSSSAILWVFTGWCLKRMFGRS